jgi:hypothetical protein
MNAVWPLPAGVRYRQHLKLTNIWIPLLRLLKLTVASGWCTWCSGLAGLSTSVLAILIGGLASAVQCILAPKCKGLNCTITVGSKHLLPFPLVHFITRAPCPVPVCSTSRLRERQCSHCSFSISRS